MRARRVLAGTTYHVVRGTVQRQFMLRPDPVVNRILDYSLAWAVLEHGMLLHGWSGMSNHIHDVVTDVRGVAPDFFRDFHRSVAMAIKAYRGLDECVWADSSTSATELHGEDAQNEAVVYGVMNPVKANLVEKAADWPGSIWLPGQRELVVKRPDVWFDGKRPGELRVPIVPPPAWSGSEDSWHERMAELVAEEEAKLGRERLRQQRPVMGRRRVLDQEATDRPRTRRAAGKKIKPVLSAGGDGELMKVLVVGLHAWRRAYLEARDRWRLDKTTKFPRGTWRKVVYDGAEIAA